MSYSGVALVGIDQRGDEYIVTSSSLCEAGYWVGNMHLERLPLDVSDERLGEAVALAQSKSQVGVANPPSRAVLPSLTQLLTVMGVKTYSQYMRGTRHVNLTFYAEGTVKVRVYRNAGGSKGFLPIDGVPPIELQATDAAAIGHAVRDALTRAT